MGHPVIDVDVLRVLSKITSLDPRWRGTTEAEVLAQVQAWHGVLIDVEWWFADEEVTRYYSTEQRWSISPGLIRDAWLAHGRDGAELDEARDERACGWARWCRCGHLPDRCNRGWLDDPEHRDGLPAKCPTCMEGRERKRSERRAHA